MSTVQKQTRRCFSLRMEVFTLQVSLLLRIPTYWTFFLSRCKRSCSWLDTTTISDGNPFCRACCTLEIGAISFSTSFVGVRDVFNKAMWLTDFRMIPAERLIPPPFTAGLGNLFKHFKRGVRISESTSILWPFSLLLQGIAAKWVFKKVKWFKPWLPKLYLYMTLQRTMWFFAMAIERFLGRWEKIVGNSERWIRCYLSRTQ